MQLEKDLFDMGRDNSSHFHRLVYFTNQSRVSGNTFFPIAQEWGPYHFQDTKFLTHSKAGIICGEEVDAGG